MTPNMTMWAADIRALNLDDQTIRLRGMTERLHVTSAAMLRDALQAFRQGRTVSVQYDDQHQVWTLAVLPEFTGDGE